MRYSKDMIEGKEYCKANWGDTMANFYTKNGDTVTVQTVYRYGKSQKPKTYTLAEYDNWQDEVRKV